jgi:hypothetical protein
MKSEDTCNKVNTGGRRNSWETSWWLATSNLIPYNDILGRQPANYLKQIAEFLQDRDKVNQILAPSGQAAFRKENSRRNLVALKNYNH